MLAIDGRSRRLEMLVALSGGALLATWLLPDEPARLLVARSER